LLKALAAAAAVLSVTTAPNVKKLGNAITEFRDPSIQAIVAYEYSHRYHDDKWLMIDAGIRTKDFLKFERMHFSMTMPDGTRIPLASQERFLDAAAVITKIRQNARVWQRELTPYFHGNPDASSFRLFAFPAEGVISGDIVTETYGPALLTLYFESPDPQWKEGSYTLTIDNGKAKAVLPIELK
jgi:hypothetical protein